MTSKPGHRKGIRDIGMIFVGVVLALVYWLVDALIDTFVHQEGDLLENLVPGDPKELWMRLVTSGLLVVLGAYVHSSNKLRRSEAARLSLQMALDESLTRLLSGFLPICANCKKIRAEDGTWTQIESYIQSHSAAKFTHGVCQECMKLLYTDHAEE